MSATPLMFIPLSRAVTRPISILALVAWVATMGMVINRSYLQAAGNLATDLARYGSTAQWRGVYYRGEKVGFTVSQVQATADGYELQEDGRLQFSLLGATTFAVLKTTPMSIDRSRSRPSTSHSIPVPGRCRSRAGLTGSRWRSRSAARPVRAPRRAPWRSHRP